MTQILLVFDTAARAIASHGGESIATIIGQPFTGTYLILGIAVIFGYVWPLLVCHWQWHY